MADRHISGRGLLHAAFSFLLPIGLIYLLICLIFSTYEPAFVFAQVAKARVAPKSAGLDGFSEVTVTAENGTGLYGWWGPPPPGHGVVVFLTGSGITMSDYAGLYRDLAEHGFGVASIDYRGNGASPGKPSEKAWRSDARAVFDFVRKAAPDAKIAVMGSSMGTGFAVELAYDRPAAGVLLDAAYASVVRLFQVHGTPLFGHLPMPLRLLMTDQIDAEAVIGKLHVPVMILHGTADPAIPITEARRLYAAAHQPKTLIEVEGGGHGVFIGEARARALAELAAWTAPDTPPGRR